MLDIHCHILPHTDDGARDLLVSLDMARTAQSQGITVVAGTPHMNIEDSDILAFLDKKKYNQNRLQIAIEEMDINVKIIQGAEIYITPALPDFIKNFGIDNFMKEVGIGGSKYILIELPMISKPEYISEVMFEISLMGLVPVIAHIERYSYLTDDLKMLDLLQSMGCCFQVNASDISKTSGYIHKIDKLFNIGYVHFIATDAHSDGIRNMKINDYISFAKKRYGEYCIDFIIDNGERIVNNEVIVGIKPENNNIGISMLSRLLKGWKKGDIR